MKADRNIEILTTGLVAAHKRLFTDKGLRRPEYPRSFGKMYSVLEDQLFALYDVIQQNNFASIVEHSGDIITTASMIAEYAGLRKDVADKEWDVKDIIGGEE
jgi:hypothetical protein